MLFDPFNYSWDFFAKLNDQGCNCATIRPRLEEKFLFSFYCGQWIQLKIDFEGQG